MLKTLYKIVFYFLLAFLAGKNSFSQNLVPNGSFEKHAHCPGDELGRFILVQDWLGLLCDDWGYIKQIKTIEYFHKCGKGLSNIPNVLSGQKKPRTGNGMAAMIFYRLYNDSLYNDSLLNDFYKEWITVPLNDTLQKDSMYCVSYYVRKTNTYVTDYWEKFNSAINVFTATFTSDSLVGIYYPSGVHWWPSSQVVYNDSLIHDTANWSRISGSFQAQGDEAYLTIGSGLAKDKIKIEPDTGKRNTAYYLIDDVAVWKCSEKASEADAGADRKICPGEKTKLGSHNLNRYRYFWFKQGNLKDTLSKNGFFYARPKTTTTYILHVKDFKYNVTRDSITVTIKTDCMDPEITNVITPNGDGYNDVFKPETKYDIHYEVTIYNRWGKLIYQGDENNPWNGKVNGQKVAEGAYYYVLKAKNPVTGYKKEYSGDITVIY